MSTDLLYLGFQPDDAAPLMLEEELDAIDGRLAASQNGQALKLHVHNDVGLEELPALLARIKPSVFHLSCHGNADGYLKLRHMGEFRDFPPEQLVELLKPAREHLRLVVLNACFSKRLRDALLSEGLTVIGADDRVYSDRAGIFSSVLYGLIAEGLDLESAFAQAREVAMAGDSARRSGYTLRGPAATSTNTIFLAPKALVEPQSATRADAPREVRPHQVVLHLDAYNGGHSVKEVKDLLDDHREERKILRLADYMGRLKVERLIHGQPVQDWAGLAAATQALIEDALAFQPDDDERPVDYIISGSAPHPTFAHVGYALSSWRGRRQIVIHRDRDGGVLQFVLGEGQKPRGGQRFFAPSPKLKATTLSRSKGQVALYLSAFGGEEPAAVLQHMEAQGGDFAEVVSLIHTTQDPSSPGQVTKITEIDGPRIAEELINTNTDLARCYPNHGGVTLFVFGPDLLAFLAGRALNPRQQRAQSLHLAYYDGKRYHTAYSLPFAVDRAPYVPQDAESKLRRRGVFDKIKRGVEALRRTLCRDDLTPPRAFSAGGERMPTKLLQQLQQLQLDEGPEGEVFELSVGRRVMKIGDGICHALRDLDDDVLERFGRLLTLHELAHQPQKLLGTNYQGVGRAGVVLEDIDYWADAFALLSVTRWEVRDLGARGEREAGKILDRNIRAHLLGMAAFDRMEQGDSLARLPERRLRRYLLWSLQRARAERVHSLSAAEALLSERLVVELAPLTGRLDAQGDKLVHPEQTAPQLFVAVGGALIRQPKLPDNFAPERLVRLTRDLKLDPLRDHLRHVVDERPELLAAWEEA
ncbi:hypothetical protein L6R49_05175 [Myxococcota bacterium]|nr:hypothetical protein [Myxococcota bacterium]